MGSDSVPILSLRGAITSLPGMFALTVIDFVFLAGVHYYASLHMAYPAYLCFGMALLTTLFLILWTVYVWMSLDKQRFLDDLKAKLRGWSS